MAKIKPFRALHYNPELYPDPTVVIAPPYDSSSAQEREALIQKSEHSIVRLLHGVEGANDTETESRYKRAAGLAEQWIKDGVLVQDDENAIYIYEQAYDIKNHRYVQRGLIALCALEDYENKVVLPHDKTSEEPILDRLTMISTLQLTVGQIHCLFTDPEKLIHTKVKSAMRETPVVEFTHESGIHQKIWKVTDTDFITQVCTFFAEKKLFIADGHHRYEASLLYRDRQKMQNPNWTPEDTSNYVLMVLTALDDPGVSLLPTHRIVCNTPMDEASMISFLKDDFQIEKVIVDRFAKELADAISHDLETTYDSKIFALYFGGDYYYRLRPLNPHALDALLPDASEAYRNLEVTVLQKLLLEKHFSIAQSDMENPQVIQYTLDACTAIETVQADEKACCILLKSTKVRQIKEIAMAGEIMPPHSTHFYPKPFSGLLIYKH